MAQPSNIHHHLYRGPKVMTDPGDGGTIRVTQDLQICEMTSTGTETRELEPPTKPGIRFVLRAYAAGTQITVNATEGLNPSLNQTALFGDDGDSLSLISVSLTATTYRWDILDGNVGSVALS